MALFGRQVILQFGLPGEAGKSFTELRVRFRVEMSSASSPNQAKIEVFNLGKESVKILQQEDSVVRLFAGYDVPLMIFQGNPIANGVRVTKQGPDRMISIEAQDGGKTYQEARVSINMATQTTVQQVLDEAAVQMGMPVAKTRSDLTTKLTQGLTYEGPARDLLDRLALSSSSNWSLRDGALLFLEDGTDSGEVAIEFSAETGNLIGAPTEKDGGVEIKALIAPSLRPGKIFSVKSEDYNGLFLAGDVAFQGDSQEGAFYVVATGTPR